MNNYQYQRPRRRHSGTMWFIFIVLIIGVIIYANSKGIINLSSINLGNLSLGANQSNSQTCVQKINTCETLHGYNLTILSNMNIQNGNDANTFLVTWKDVSQSGNISDYNVTSYPIAMVATKVPSSNVLHVFICKSDGNIEERTQSGFC
jgi:hypothetical protein